MKLHRIKLLFLSLAALFVGGLRDTFASANSAEGVGGTHPDGIISKAADASHATRHLLVKTGTDADHIAACGAGDLPLGVTDDEPSAAEDLVNVALLGAAPGTRRVMAATALAAGIDLYTAASGLVQALPTAAGTYYKVGRSVTVGQLVATNKYVVEAELHKPEVLVIGTTTVKAGATLAVPITARAVVMTTGGAEALTLANGTPGQRLLLILGTDGGDGTLTPTTKTGFATIVFADAGDFAELEFVNATAGWILIGCGGVAAPPAITV